MSQFNTTVLCSVNTFVLARAHPCPDNHSMELNERIISAREHAHLTREDLADMVGCSLDMISKLERGERKKTSLIVKLARACRVNVDWLDSGEGSMLSEEVYARDEKEKRALIAMQSMPEYQKDTAIKILDSLIEPSPSTGTNGSTSTKQ